MANENINVGVGVDASQATQGFNEVAGAAKSFRQQCKELQDGLTKLTLEGKEGSKEYQNMAKQLGALRDAMDDASREANSYANDTRKMSLAIGALKDGIGVYQSLTGAMEMFGAGQSDAAETTKKLMAIQSTMNGLQAVYQSLLDKSTIAGKLYAKTSQLMSAAMSAVAKSTGASSKAMGIFKKALISTGIGAIVVVVGELIAHWDELTSAVDDSESSWGKVGKAIQKVRDIANGVIETFKSLGTIIGDVFNGDFEKAGKDATEAFARGMAKAKTDINNKYTETAKWLDDEVAEQKEKDFQKDLKALEAQFDREELQRLKNHEEKTTAHIVHELDRKIALYKKYKKDTVKIEIDRQKEINKLYEENSAPGLGDVGLSIVGNKDLKPSEQIGSYTGGNIKANLPKGSESNGPEASGGQKFASLIAENNDDIQTFGQAASQLADMTTDAITSMFDRELEAITANLDAVDERIDQTTEKIAGHSENIANYQTALAEASGADKQRLLDQIAMENEAMAEEEKRLADEQKEKDKLKKAEAEAEYKKKKADAATQIIQSIINTALGISSAVAQNPMGGGLPGSAIAAAMGAAQTAIIAANAAKIKKSYGNGGLLEGPLHSEGGIPVGATGVEVEGGEFVVNRRATAANLPLLMAINGGAGNSRLRYADGGVLNVDTRDYVNYQPVVSVVDINRVQEQMVRVADMAR